MCNYPMTDKKNSWFNPEEPPPAEIKTGGFVKSVVGKIPVDLVDPIEVSQMRDMPGVDTNLIEEEGKKKLEISVNRVVIPDKAITGEKKKGPLQD